MTKSDKVLLIFRVRICLQSNISISFPHGNIDIAIAA
jgi:hypothetical protein